MHDKQHIHYIIESTLHGIAFALHYIAFRIAIALRCLALGCSTTQYIQTNKHTYIHTLHYVTLHYITLHYITLHHITLHYVTLHNITLPYITLHTLHTLHYIAYMCTCFGCLGHRKYHVYK
jgi:hypothetical protein